MAGRDPTEQLISALQAHTLRSNGFPNSSDPELPHAGLNDKTWIADWYIPKASDEEVSRMLQGKPQGSFLIRDSPLPGHFILYLRYLGQTMKYTVTKDSGSNAGFHLEDSAWCFQKLSDLVHTYSDPSSLELHDLPCVLLVAAREEIRPREGSFMKSHRGNPDVHTTSVLTSSNTTSPWSVADVSAWLTANGYREYVPRFAESQIDGQRLLHLTVSDLQHRLAISNSQHVLDILRLIEELKKTIYREPSVTAHGNRLHRKTLAVKNVNGEVGVYDVESGERITNLGALMKQQASDALGSHHGAPPRDTVKLSPSAYAQYPWWQVGKPKMTALGLLERGENGSFIIRDSESIPSAYVLSYVYQDKIYHELLYFSERGAYPVVFLEKEPSLLFRTVLELIEYFKSPRPNILHVPLVLTLHEEEDTNSVSYAQTTVTNVRTAPPTIMQMPPTIQYVQQPPPQPIYVQAPPPQPYYYMTMANQYYAPPPLVQAPPQLCLPAPYAYNTMGSYSTYRGGSMMDVRPSDHLTIEHQHMISQDIGESTAGSVRSMPVGRETRSIRSVDQYQDADERQQQGGTRRVHRHHRHHVHHRGHHADSHRQRRESDGEHLTEASQHTRAQTVARSHHMESSPNDYAWLRKDISSRRDAEKFLRGSSEGEFVVYKVGSGKYELAQRSHGNIKFYSLLHKDKSYFLETSSKRFYTLEELVHYYQRSHKTNHDLEVPLHHYSARSADV